MPAFPGTRLFLPDVPEAQRKHFSSLLRFAIECYRLCLRLPGMRQLLFLIGPVICSVSQKGVSGNR